MKYSMFIPIFILLAVACRKEQQTHSNQFITADSIRVVYYKDAANTEVAKHVMLTATQLKGDTVTKSVSSTKIGVYHFTLIHSAESHDRVKHILNEVPYMVTQENGKVYAKSPCPDVYVVVYAGGSIYTQTYDCAADQYPEYLRSFAGEITGNLSLATIKAK